MTLVPELSAQAKAIVDLAFRNGPHRGPACGKTLPDVLRPAGVLPHSADEIKTVMKAVVDTMYRSLRQREFDPEKYQRNVLFGLRYTANWDEP